MICRILPIAICLVAFGSLVGTAQALDLEKLKKDVEEGKALLIDVREEVEWKKFHLVDSESVPFSTIAMDSGARRVGARFAAEPEVKVYAISDDGRVSQLASDMFKRVNVKVIAVKTPYRDFVSAGFKEYRSNDPNAWQQPIPVLPP